MPLPGLGLAAASFALQEKLVDAFASSITTPRTGPGAIVSLPSPWLRTAAKVVRDVPVS